MRIKILDNIEDFRCLKSDWDLLYSKDKEYTVFQSFNYNYYSWKNELLNSNSKLSIICVELNGQICSIFPFYIDIRKRIRFINDTHSDFCDCLTTVTLDFKLIEEALRVRFMFRQIQLINLKKDSKILSFKNIISKSKNSTYSFLTLEKGIFPENFKRYKSKQKTEFRRILKKNKDNKHLIVNADVAEFPLKEIQLLRNEMISLGLRNKSFLRDAQIDLLKQLFDKKDVILSLVKDNSKFKAVSFIINRFNKHLFWIDMYDESKMINLFNYINFISKKSLKNSIIINFGRGLYSYKISNFLPEKRDLFSVSIYSSNWQEFKFNFEKKLIQFLKYLLWKVR
ncbi:MAG: hypothetical protein CMD02_00650 [Flavobacteriales bacterium]|nr:hypothetical protein [Flavobacteriales bacterium]